MLSRPRTPFWRTPLALLAAMSLALVVTVTGCSNVSYYAQAISGHLAVMRAAQPIDQVIDDPASDPALKEKLADVQAIRNFASLALALPDNGSYRRYADLGRPYVVWNVFAAPEFSLQARSWCLLMVGCVNYRGYYDRHDAERLAAQLRQDGYDTYVAGVPAYSTLGYFDDPVLNTFLRLGTLEVARTVFHELAHQQIFVAGDTSFNESFATAVEDEGMRRWLATNATPEARAAFTAQKRRKTELMALLHDYRQQFVARYGAARSSSEQRDAKAELLAALRRDYAVLKVSWGAYAGYDQFFGDDLNNAKLASLSLYSELVPAFAALLEQQNHDLPLFYRRVAALAALDKDARRDALQQIVAAAAESRYGADDQAEGALILARSGCGACQPDPSSSRRALPPPAGTVGDRR
ncbi:aminopeptidase [Candidatus Accumulibacter sp. ACC003]|uniref:aminopeptidase n=1 Tax=Candidatus Accumulibacter sp. ACC003 TaxID=2823334 RepID=UPI0025BB8755|nr:aminopeptidase [Candidatus Accumulibacter sp. ACC003]